ncbi:MAG: GNAT family N-acetyltransferase [Planctomycetota bacterium]|jgi:GNAT superfamily N-acetyltransferase
MAREKAPVDVPEPYSGSLFRPPVGAALAGALADLLGHKGRPWLRDIGARLSGEGRDLFGVAFRGDRPVAHAWLGSSEACPETALLGHVYTVEEHRRYGLATALAAALLERFDGWGGRWVQLRTANEVAAPIYERLGFRTVRTGREPGRPQLHRVMLRGGGPEGVGTAYHEWSGRWVVEPFGRAHYPALCVFLNALGGSGKLRLLKVNTGLSAEFNLLNALAAQERGTLHCAVLVDQGSGRPHGLACVGGEQLELYAPRVGEQVRESFARQAQGQDQAEAQSPP